MLKTLFVVSTALAIGFSVLGAASAGETSVTGRGRTRAEAIHDAKLNATLHVTDSERVVDRVSIDDCSETAGIHGSSAYSNAEWVCTATVTYHTR